ncbi:hypothetical protein NQ315_008930 [Exocentrus adspersus]|uniref:Uncharacterized protein n=1 Tax=Exocentrus adspersus TaxID=1586481 RepID=A0AAV8V5X2_9CUCU|nr:hypothetical protein NQ315_008930 [Exocentrus adspersus]
MGYGSRALHLLKQYYQFEIHSYESQTTHENVDSLIMELGSTSSVEFIEPKRGLPPLLLKLTERPPEKLEYLGVSFGLTEELLKFWKRAEFVPVYLRQTTNELTGEHSCIMLNVLNRTLDETESHWLEAYWTDFRRRFIHLLSYQFKLFHPSLALGLLSNNSVKYTSKDYLLTQNS